MYFRSTFNIITILGIIVVFLLSCSDDESNASSSTDDEIEVIIPSELTFTINIAGKDANNLNGDGSGIIQCAVTATNATSYSFRPGTGAEVNNTTGIFEHTYTTSGINNYTVQVLAYSSTGHSVIASEEIAIAVATNTNLVWSDEFNSNGSPDTNKWNYDIGNGCPNICGWGNSELQYYTSRPDNVIIEGGILKINAKREDYSGYEYTSTRMKTQGKFDFKYGKIEIRAKLPEGGGTWPAIWMLGSNITSVGWPDCGEIDIMEHRGNDQGNASSAIHTPSSYGNTINKGSRYISDVSTEFHVYATNWTSEKIEFSIDDIIHYTYNPSIKDSNTWPFDANQFIILNVAMGGTFGGSIESGFTESTMEIDYIRVYQ